MAAPFSTCECISNFTSSAVKRKRYNLALDGAGEVRCYKALATKNGSFNSSTNIIFKICFAVCSHMWPVLWFWHVIQVKVVELSAAFRALHCSPHRHLHVAQPATASRNNWPSQSPSPRPECAVRPHPLPLLRDSLLENRPALRPPPSRYRIRKDYVLLRAGCPVMTVRLDAR